MGLSSLPTPSEGVLTLLLVNTALSVSILRSILLSLLRSLRSHPPPSPPEPEDSAEPSLADRFRARFQPVRFRSAKRPAADCRVCLVRFEPDSVVNRLPCGHLFHRACLETWLDYRHATCPLCRTHILWG